MEHLVLAARQGRRRGVHGREQAFIDEITDEFAGFLDEGEAVLATIRCETDKMRIGLEGVEEGIGREIDRAGRR